MPASPPCRPAQVEQLAGFGLALEKEFGWPQDVEWALTAEDRLVVLQSRPLQLLRAPEPAACPRPRPRRP